MPLSTIFLLEFETAQTVWYFLVFHFIINIINIFVGEVQYRLTGGKDQNSGRVEININGIWGTMCDDEFDATSAKVLCKQLGLPS